MRLSLVILLFVSAMLHAEPFGTPRTLREIKGRIDMSFDDGTIIRAGMNARFNYVPGTREVELKSGAILFSSPKGAGGGLLRSANVITTTTAGDVQVANQNGSVKVICLNGKMLVASTANFSKRTSLKPGQMVTVSSGAKDIPDAETLNLSVLISTSGLMSMGPLPSQSAIQKNAAHQKGVPPIGVPLGSAESIAMTTENLLAQENARQSAQIAAAQQLANEQILADRRIQAQQQQEQQQVLAAQKHAADKAAQEQAAQQAQQQASNQQGNQSGGPQGNQGKGPQGNQGNQGNQGKPPNVPPGQAKKQ